MHHSNEPARSRLSAGRAPDVRRRDGRNSAAPPRTAVLGWTTLWAVIALAVATETRAAERPHFLVILADDLGFSDLGCYGGEIATPHLDALAADGLRFTQFYNTARCWPTRAALLTGYYAQQVRRDTVSGVRSGGRGIRPAWARLLPERLRRLGYRSYHSGKWHLDGKPLRSGFDHSYNLTDQGRFFSPQRHEEDDEELPPVERGSGYYATTAIADHAIRCLKEHASEHAEKPFFLFLAFTAPHFPLHALPEDIERYRDRYREGWEAVRAARWRRVEELGIVRGTLSAVEPDVGPPYDFPEALEKLGPGEVARPLPWDTLSGEQRSFQATKMAIHAAMVDRMDREIGRVLAQLRAMNAFEDTLILFLSDNGASAEIMVRDDGHDPSAPPGSAATHLCLGPGWSTTANTPFRRHKTWVHEGGIATPLIAHWSQGISARGALRRQPGHVIDIVPTLLELAGAPAAHAAHPDAPAAPGKSLAGALRGDEPVERESLWWLHEGNRALRAGDWKLVAAGADGPWELYDLSADRAETKDLAEEQPDRVRRLAAEWTRQHEEYAELARRELTTSDAPARAPPERRLVLPGEWFWLGDRPAFVLLPALEKRRAPQPWILYAPTLEAYPDDHEKWMHEQFLAAGVAVAGVDVGEAYGSPAGRTAFSALHGYLTRERRFAPKPCLLGRSRGGLWVTSWATRNTEKVAGIAGIYPVFDLRTYPGLEQAAPAYGLSAAQLEETLGEHNPIARADELANARVPVFIIHGDEDRVVPLAQNSAALARRYEALGARALLELEVVEGQGHNFWPGFFRSEKLVDFAIRSARAGAE